ncbi:uncharacterized protein AB675_11901 [Cyphellophora attinorum]|uniref:Uncharacterized protein n=1 Tax=Cyphellophora attinorum TaxID=1664694 RepID=A0A0N0NI31_9EURO|nr:uncharacterized protein AB675_11901 [Phialophora attinorum]KPI34969.1 hypothetical protein AB675_11901 [Phialophora attinorum]
MATKAAPKAPPSPSTAEGILLGISGVFFGILFLALFCLGCGLVFIAIMGCFGTTYAFYAWLGCRIGLMTPPEAGCASLWGKIVEVFAELSESDADQAGATRVMAAVSEEIPLAAVEASADNGFITPGTIVGLLVGALLLCMALLAWNTLRPSPEADAGRGVNMDREELRNILRKVEDIAQKVDGIENKVNSVARKVDEIAMRAQIFDEMPEYTY